ncbi:MAG: thioredoxin fold domain-containing protein [Gammaproteobacteria bacterium]|nr:thioredoxin fold domain-containing protein [Gammaproteobacteria bacterium]MCP5137348.1 thioredoxin fold domain-containing protein [Gammaproteobacteria bacterium]
MSMTLRLLSGIVLLAAASVVWSASAPRNPEDHFFHKTLGDFSEDLADARANGKKAVFVFFEMDECRWCKKMKETVLNQPEVQDWYRSNFLNLAVDVEGDVEINDLHGEPMSEQRFAIISTANNERDLARPEYKKPTPYFVFFDMDGNRIYSVPGIVKGIDEFMLLGRFIVDEAYKSQSFTAYKKAVK